MKKRIGWEEVMAQLKEKNTQNTNKDMHLIPQNTDAEEAVLGAILVNPVVLTKVVEGLKPDCFHKPAHRHVYEAMLQLFNQNERIDIVSVSNVLDYSQKLETVGGRAFINDLALNAISTANIEYYSKIIQEKQTISHKQRKSRIDSFFFYLDKALKI